jgi:hypothetical protein
MQFVVRITVETFRDHPTRLDEPKIATKMSSLKSMPRGDLCTLGCSDSYIFQRTENTEEE